MSNFLSRLIDLAVQIQQIPSPTFEEKVRGEFVRGLFVQEDLKDVTMDKVGNVLARLPGGDSVKRPLVVCAHLDTVFRHETNLQVRKEAGKVFGPGLGDNSLGVAALFGIIWALREQHLQLKHDIWLAANVCEEGLGDLLGMRSVVERFGSDVIGYLVLEGLAFGHVYNQAIGVQRYRIRVQTAGGHSWSDYGKPSAIHELASLLTQLTALRLSREPRTTLNVGTISGGTGVNVLASDATCELDLRSESPAALAKLIAQVKELIRSTSREGVNVACEIVGQRPAGEIPADHPFVQLGIRCVQEQGLTATLTGGSTDANIPLSRRIPAVVLGVTTGGGAHTMQEFIEVEPVQKGIQSIVRFVEQVGK